MKKILLSIMLCAFLLILSASVISACGYHNHKTCDVKATTIIEGKITLAENHKAVGNVNIKITCVHNGQTYEKDTKSSNSKLLKGTYMVTFPQSQCKDNDMVTVTATTKDGAVGTSIGKVRDFIKEKCLDIDVALINVKIPMVPEFSLLAGTLTILGATGMFFVVRRK